VLSNNNYSFRVIGVVVAVCLLTIFSACQAAGPPSPTPTPGFKTRWEVATFTPNPAKAHFTPSPTSPTRLEQKDALESELDQAVAKLTKAIEDDQTDAGAYNERGLAYAKQDKLEESVADFTKAIELDPNLVTAYNNRGKSYGEQRKFDEAIADLTKAIQLDADYAIAYYNRGVALQNSQRRKEAAEDYKKYLELRPDAPERAQVKQLIQLYGE
jgi:tetratricopeptide (TPR) repeat protein